jgi:hypothetical protein
MQYPHAMPATLQFAIVGDGRTAAKGLPVAGSPVSFMGTLTKTGKPAGQELAGGSAGELWQAALAWQSESDNIGVKVADQLAAVMNADPGVESLPAQETSVPGVRLSTEVKTSMEFSEKIKPVVMRTLQGAACSAATMQSRNEKVLVKGVLQNTSTIQSDSVVPPTPVQLPNTFMPPAPVVAPIRTQHPFELNKQGEKTAEPVVNGGSLWARQNDLTLGSSSMRAQAAVLYASANAVSTLPAPQIDALKAVHGKTESESSAPSIAPVKVTANESQTVMSATSLTTDAHFGVPAAVSGSSQRADMPAENLLKATQRAKQIMHVATPHQAMPGLQQISDSKAIATIGQIVQQSSHVTLGLGVTHAGNVQADLTQPASLMDRVKSPAAFTEHQQKQIAGDIESREISVPVHTHLAAQQRETRSVVSAAKSAELVQVHKEAADGIGAASHSVATSDLSENTSIEPVQSQTVNVAAAVVHASIAVKPGQELESSNLPVATAGMKSEISSSVLAPRLQELHVRSGGSVVEAAVSDGELGRIEVSASRTPDGVAATVKLGTRPSISDAVAGLEARAEVGGAGVSVTGLKEFLSVNQTPVSSLHLEQFQTAQSQVGSGDGVTEFGGGFEQRQQRGDEGTNQMQLPVQVNSGNEKQLPIVDESAKALSLHSGRMVSVMA